ncbi:MAG: FAD-dependent protein [Saprospiraceae bacterium]
MIQFIEISILPSELDFNEIIETRIAEALSERDQSGYYHRIIKRSLDARKSPVYKLRIEISDKAFEPDGILTGLFKDVSQSKPVLIIGAGPAGYFAALECLMLGLKPIVIDRGKDARTRRRDLRAIQQFHLVDPDSNYCFGEGGAGTYSDGKLYTRSGKRGNINKVLQLFVEHGANPDILIDAHPHIGSNKLPEIIQNIRTTIINNGGEVHFSHKLIDFEIRNDKIRSITTNQGLQLSSDAVILCTGHSARDIFYLMASKNLLIESKAFALGVRIEHPQALIDSIQYHRHAKDLALPPSSYSLACTSDGRGVFSFCMCPGGLMVPSATAPGEIVINGMSLSKRDSKFANSGTVVSIFPADFDHPEDPFCTLNFQKEVEQKVFLSGDGSQRAPAQRLEDFIQNKWSTSLPDASYIPGLWSASLHEILPGVIIKPLQRGILEFASKMKGYLTNEAVVVATESRTSSPVRIPRNSLSMHPQCAGLFPCGEGAGYAGGIVSAAMDGQHCARAALQYLFS